MTNSNVNVLNNLQAKLRAALLVHQDAAEAVDYLYHCEDVSGEAVCASRLLILRQAEAVCLRKVAAVKAELVEFHASH